ncbi:MAG: hypothetical protein GC150_03455 [Rhizobiales bacterium]|nr:hypothetical protein [Hyphomicrobiales bacterium]
MIKSTLAALAIAAAALLAGDAPAKAFTIGEGVGAKPAAAGQLVTPAGSYGYTGNYGNHSYGTYGTYGKKHHYGFYYRRNQPLYFGYGPHHYAYKPYYYKKHYDIYDPCHWLRKKAVWTGSYHWWKKYEHCKANAHYDHGYTHY